MTGKGVVCAMGEHIPIEGADRIVQVNILGEVVITQKENKPGEIGILFDCETQLSLKFCYENNMFTDSSMNRDKTVKGYIGKNRRIRPIRLKGVKCSALWMPLNSLDYLKSDTPQLLAEHLGSEFNELDGQMICERYVPPRQKQLASVKQGKAREELAPTFKEHFNTDQLGRNAHKVEPDNLVIITEKLHGTSCRAGYLPVRQKWNIFRKLWALVTNRNLKDFDYRFVVGSRRVVKSIEGEGLNGKEHFYKHDLWTEVARKKFEGKLRKGESVYFEIVGYDLEGNPIMGSHSNEKLRNFMSKQEYADFLATYGDTTVFEYGCIPQHYPNEVYVYRVTTTNEDGVQYDLSWDQVKGRCEELGVSHVPELMRFLINNGDHLDHDPQDIVDLATELAEDGSDNFPGHLREGVCVRAEGRNVTPMVLKQKGYFFKVLEGIVKENDNHVDVEETN